MTEEALRSQWKGWSHRNQDGPELNQTGKVSGWVDQRFTKLFRKRKVLCKKKKALLLSEQKHMHTKKEGESLASLNSRSTIRKSRRKLVELQKYGSFVSTPK